MFQGKRGKDGPDGASGRKGMSGDPGIQGLDGLIGVKVRYNCQLHKCLQYVCRYQCELVKRAPDSIKIVIGNLQLSDMTI